MQNRECGSRMNILVGCLLLACLSVLVIAGCGGDRKSEAATARTESAEVAAPPPQAPTASETPAAQPATPDAGEPDDTPAPAQPRVAEPRPAEPRAQAPAPAVQPQSQTGAPAAAEVPAEEPPLPVLTPVGERRPAPAFEATDMAGRPVSLAGMKGKVGLVVFWATWCRPCMMEIPHLVRLQQSYGKQGLSIVGLSIDRRGMAVVKPFVDKHPEINYPIVPSGLAAADAFGGIASIPTSFLIDREGRVIRMFVGLMPGETLEGFVKAALQEAS